MGRSAHAAGGGSDDHRTMDERGMLHLIEDDLSETWVADAAREGVDDVELYLAKHLAFLTYLDEASA
jgi:hypothetical protein